MKLFVHDTWIFQEAAYISTLHTKTSLSRYEIGRLFKISQEYFGTTTAWATKE